MLTRIHTTNFGFNAALRCSIKKGQYYVEPHIHQFSEIVLVKKGTLAVTVDGKRETANEGDFVFISAFRTHTLLASDDAEIWICVFSNDFISDFNEGDVYYLGERAVFTPSNLVRDFFASKFIDSAERFLVFDAAAFRRCKAGIYAVYEEYTRLVPSSALPKQTEKRSVIHQVLEYVHRNFKQELSLVSVAHALGYNPEYISHALSAINGLNFRFLVNSFRVEHAKNQLISSKRTLSDISEECGFSCERSFHRAFKSITGKTPGEYRAEWKTPSFETGKGDARYATKPRAQ
ncbi:MAG: AraC family transcriptional regulator [Ruminococcaceae bacterium]|nr:AraC family transcriptional regulator [Oscillospiraceae bacterium]